MARQRVVATATAAPAGRSAARTRLDGMSRGELVVECEKWRGRCAEKDRKIRDLSRKAEADAAERTGLARKCRRLEKKAANQQKALKEANDRGDMLAREVKEMVAKFAEAKGNLEAVRKAERHYRAKAAGAKPKRRPAKKAAKKAGGGGTAARRKAPRKAGGRGGANSIRGEPDNVFEVDAERCPVHGHKLPNPSAERTRRLQELVQIQTLINDYRSKGRWCARCNKMHYAPVPNAVPNSPLDLYTHLFALCLRLAGMSKGKILFMMSVVLGIPHMGSRSTISKMIRRIAGLLGPEYDRLRGELLKELNIHGDETSWSVDGKIHWLWAFIGRWVAYFTIDPSRGSGVPARVLGAYKGNVTSDSWPAWNKVGGTHQKCHVHYIRWLNERLEFGSPSKEYRRFASTLKRILRDSQKAAEKRMSSKEKALVIKRLEGRIERLISKSYRSRECGAMVKRLKREKGMLFTFIMTGTAPDNNPAERPIRVPVTVRKVIGGNRTIEGAQDYAVILTVDMSARLRGSHFLEFCTDLLGNAGKSKLTKIA